MHRVLAGPFDTIVLLIAVVLVAGFARAVRKARAQLAALDRVATRDEVTGLANRLGFQRALGALLASGTAAGALLLVEVDGFREVKETFGTESGDLLLAEVGRRLLRLERPAAVARLGEDEFGLLLGTTDEDEIRLLAVDVIVAFARPFELGEARIAADAIAGAALIPAHGCEFPEVLEHAEAALTQAKEAHLRLKIYGPTAGTASRSRLVLTGALRTAAREQQLVVHYQPQADLAMNVIRGVEALVRWEHPEHGLLSADAFMPLAEHGGLVGEIDRFVLETAADQWRRWHSHGLSLDIAVNVSAVDLLDPDLATRIESLIEQNGLPPEYLVLEITEHSLLRNEQRVGRTLELLRAIGVRLAVDDYGTGYSSLRYLRNLPAQQVKLDRTFIAGIPADRVNTKIVGSTIKLAHALGATVVAEGVETRAQWEHLAALNCDIAQGYLIGVPQPADELTPHLIESREHVHFVTAAGWAVSV